MVRAVGIEPMATRPTRRAVHKSGKAERAATRAAAHRAATDCCCPSRTSVFFVIPVMLDVVLRRLVRMVRRMHAVPVRRVGMMRGFFVVAGNVMFGGLAMMSRGLGDAARHVLWSEEPHANSRASREIGGSAARFRTLPQMALRFFSPIRWRVPSWTE